MDKKVCISLVALFVVFVGFQFAEPATAVKVVDHGNTIGWDTQIGWSKMTWKTYQYNNNFVKSYSTCYVKKHGKYVFGYSEVFTLAKVTKSTIKITDWVHIANTKPMTIITHKKTKLTAAQYYWREIRTIYTH